METVETAIPDPQTNNNSRTSLGRRIQEVVKTAKAIFTGAETYSRTPGETSFIPPTTLEGTGLVKR